jgi:hypothetical protein
MNETNSIVLSAAKAIRTFLECKPALSSIEISCKGKTRLYHVKEHDGLLPGGGRVHEGLVEQVTIKTNLPGIEWLNGSQWNTVAEQCEVIGKAFGCQVEVDDNGLRGHRNRLEVTVTHPKMVERIECECFDNGSA